MLGSPLQRALPPIQKIKEFDLDGSLQCNQMTLTVDPVIEKTNRVSLTISKRGETLSKIQLLILNHI